MNWKRELLLLLAFTAIFLLADAVLIGVLQEIRK